MQKPITKTKKAIDLKPDDLILDWIDDKHKLVDVFPVWNVIWCDCWEVNKGSNSNRLKYAGFKKDGKVQYDMMLGLETDVDYPHSIYCNKPESGRLSPLHLKVNAFNYDMMADVGGRAYNKTNDVEVLVSEGDYRLQTGGMFYKDITEVIQEWSKFAENKNQEAFDIGQYHIDVADYSSEQLLAIVIKDAMSHRFFLSEFPVDECTLCWHEFGRNGIDPKDTIKKYTLKELIYLAVQRYERFVMPEGQDQFKKVLEKAKLGKLTRLEYLQIFNGEDIELV